MTKPPIKGRFTNLKLVQGQSFFEGSEMKLKVPKKRITYLKPNESFEGFIALEFRCQDVPTWYRIYNPDCLVYTQRELITLMCWFDRNVVLRGYTAMWTKGVVSFSARIEAREISSIFYNENGSTENE